MSERFEGLAPSEVAAALGVLLLLLIAGVPVVSGRHAWGPVLTFLLGLGVGGWASAAWIRAEGLVPRDSDVSRHLKAGLKEFHENVRKPRKNVLIVAGGSYVAYGLSPKVLESRLRQQGYDARVIHLAEPGANHFERRQLYRDLVEHPRSELSETPAGSNVVLLEEVQLKYDSEPMVQIGENLGTARLSYYMTPGAAVDALWSVHWGGGEMDEKVHHLEWKVVRHAIVQGFSVGAVDRLTHLGQIHARGGFTPARPAPFKFNGAKAAEAATRGPVSPLDLPWLWQVREPVIEQTFAGELDAWVYFAVPPTHAKYVSHSRSFCEATDKPCIPLDDPGLYKKLRGRKNWHDAGHLSYLGAAVFSRWLADELAASGVLRK